MENYFVRVAEVEVSDDDEEDNQQLQNFPIHALRARLLRGQAKLFKIMTPTQIPHHLSAPSPHPPPRILPNKDPLQFSTPLPSLKRFLAQTPLLHQVLQSKKLVCELLLFLSNRDPHSLPP